MKVSIITVTYNSDKTLQDTIDSVRNQNYQNIEYIIVDGNSSDKTLDIISQNLDIITKWVSEPDKGIYDAMNKGVKMATGDIVGIINSDDFYADENVIKAVVNEFLISNCPALYGNLMFVDPKNKSKIIRKWYSSKYREDGFLLGWHPPHPTFFLKTKYYEKFGLFDVSFNISADFELMFRMIQKYNLSPTFLDKVLVHMRYGGESTRSLKNIIEGNKNIKKAFEKNGYSFSYIYFFKRAFFKLKQFI